MMPAEFERRWESERRKRRWWRRLKRWLNQQLPHAELWAGIVFVAVVIIATLPLTLGWVATGGSSGTVTFGTGPGCYVPPEDLAICPDE